MVDASVVWDQAFSRLSTTEETKSQMARAWLNYLVPVSLDDRQMVFAVKHLQAKQWIEKRYLPYIKEVVTEIVEGAREISLVIDESLGQSISALNAAGSVAGNTTSTFPAVSTADAHPLTTPAPSISPSLTSSHYSTSPLQATTLSDHHGPAVPPSPRVETPPSSSPHSESPPLGSGLRTVFAPDNQAQSSLSVEPHSRLTFSNYVVGPSNVMPFSSSQRVAETPGLYFNPLFIYGKSGLGKTHLLRSIENYINAYLIDKRVVYAPITEFVNDFTNAMAGDRDLTSFKKKYHTCDVLLIDDVQALEGKGGTTDALFEIFNMFIENKKQIVLSADRSPVEINIDERFTSRFAQGLPAEIHPPNYEMKTAILKNYKRYCCSFLNVPEVDFEDEAMQKIVELSGSNIRELEGAVNKLIAHSSSGLNKENPAPVTYEDVENILGSAFFHQYTRRVNFDMVVRAVESYFKVSRAELLSEKRSKNISHPRQVAMYLIRRYTDMSYPEIGDGFNKDHTTVMYADKNIQAKMVEEVSVKIEVEKIAEILTS